MAGKSSGISGMVTSGLMEFWPGLTLESLCAMICLASARVHFEVKSDAGSCAVWVWGVGRGKPGAGAGIWVLDGGHAGCRCDRYCPSQTPLRV
jgi:hypothetical protein